QVHNFDIHFDDLIKYYPLEKVREIHISGGSWEPASSLPSRTIRRDTHDDAVPEVVFDFLEKTLPLCPNIKFTVLEQLGNGLKTTASHLQFQRDFHRMNEIIQKAATGKTEVNTNNFLPGEKAEISSNIIEDQLLSSQQQQLSDI